MLRILGPVRETPYSTADDKSLEVDAGDHPERRKHLIERRPTSASKMVESEPRQTDKRLVSRGYFSAAGAPLQLISSPSTDP